MTTGRYILLGIVIFVIGSVAYLMSPLKKPGIAKNKNTEASKCPRMDTVEVAKKSDTSTDKQKPTVKGNNATVQKNSTAETAIPEVLPKINVVKEVPTETPASVPGVKVTKEKTRGIRASKECYRLVLSAPEKTIKIPNCRGGLIVFNSLESLSGVEAMLVVTKSDEGDFYSLVDEKNGDMGFNYAPIESILDGKIRPTICVYALAFIEKEDEYAILKCSDALAPKLSDNRIRIICLTPVIAGIKSLESANDILHNECYLGEGSLKLLMPQKIQVSQR
jgi:hypothetical protein